MSPREAIGVALILVALAVPVIVVGVVYYLKKRFEHRQIMTAIEKGTPLSELRPPKQNGALWIRTITIGVALLALSLALVFLRRPGPGGTLIAVLFAVGLAWIVRGWLHRKYQPQNQSLDKGNTAENKNSVKASALVTPPQSVDQPGSKE